MQESDEHASVAEEALKGEAPLDALRLWEMSKPAPLGPPGALCSHPCGIGPCPEQPPAEFLLKTTSGGILGK